MTTAEKNQQKCASFGFQSGTEAFSGCMMKLYTERQREIAVACQAEKESQANEKGGGGFAYGASLSLRLQEACATGLWRE